MVPEKNKARKRVFDSLTLAGWRFLDGGMKDAIGKWNKGIESQAGIVVESHFIQR